MNVNELSFVDSAATPKNIWISANTGSWDIDNNTGRERAAECINYMHANNAPCFFGHIVQAMILSGVYGGVEAGFMSEIAIRATT